MNKNKTTLFVSKEDTNFISRLIEPRFLIYTGFHWIGVFYLKLIKGISNIFRLAPYRYSDYLSYIKNQNLRDNSKIARYNKGFLGKLSSPDKTTDAIVEDGPFKLPLYIELATQKIMCNDFPEWLQKFDDKEDILALHRWGWLLDLSVNNPSSRIKNWGIKIIEDWFLKMGRKKEHPAWESYSVSERIANIVLFFYCLRHWPSEDTDGLYRIEENLIDMASFLKDHLEFRGNLTNNHILNNARAIYILGRVASCQELADIGRQIFIKETPKMITPSGFLREGSSNYHILLLRTYLEVLWAAEYTKDVAFVEMIKVVAKSMVNAAWFFNVYDKDNKKWLVPLAGDTSPDFPPAWLNNICRSEPALKLQNHFGYNVDLSTGWNRLWNSSNSKRNQSQLKNITFPKYQLFHDSGWYRADYGEWTIFWYICPDGSLPPYSHGHNDICSFMLYWKGCQVITDPGRFSYEKNLLGLYGKSAVAHNTYTIDRLEPYPLGRNIYPPEYIKVNHSIDWDERKDGFYFRISHTGFHRIDKRLLASREFFITENSLKIKDAIQGFGKHNVRTFFHFASDVELSDPDIDDSIKINLKNDLGKLIFKDSLVRKNVVKNVISGQTSPEPMGWHFPKYGHRLPIKTMVIETDADFPYRAEYAMLIG